MQDLHLKQVVQVVVEVQVFLLAEQVILLLQVQLKVTMELLIQDQTEAAVVVALVL